MGNRRFPNKRILRNNLCLPACKEKNIATKLEILYKCVGISFFVSVTQQTISFLLDCSKLIGLWICQGLVA